MPLRRFWFLILIASASIVCRASVDFSSAPIAVQTPLVERERRVWNSAVHDSEFAAIPQTVSHATCEATQLPQALATPDPLLEEADMNAKVSVSFIIGIDGRVHSALILESAGTSEDRTILDAVRFWRYRPAMCNGVPTDAEAKVEFSSR